MGARWAMSLLQKSNVIAGNWGAASNWAENAIPTAADNVFFTDGSNNHTGTLNVSSTILGLTISNPTLGLLSTVDHNSASTLSATFLDIAVTSGGRGAYTQTAGTASFVNYLRIGDASDRFGTYTIAGRSLLCAATGAGDIGALVRYHGPRTTS